MGMRITARPSVSGPPETSLPLCDERLTRRELLNGGIFKGRHLVADCRNANQRISIRTLVDVGQPLRSQNFMASSGPLAGYSHDHLHVSHNRLEGRDKDGLTGNVQTDGYYESLEPLMDGLELESYPYGYGGYQCGYSTGEYWPSSVEPPTETHSRRESAMTSPDPVP